MIMKANKQIGFIYKDEESIDRILKDGEVVFERGFLREKTSTTLPITFGGVGKDLKDYKIYGNTYQNSTSGENLYTINSMRSKTASVIIDGETINISYDNTNGASVKYNEFHTTLSSLIKENEAYSIVCEILEISGTGTLRLNSPNSNVNESQFTLGSAYNISNLTPGQILIENVTALNSFENATRCVRSNIRVNVGQSCHAKLRMSLIKGTINPNDFVYEPYTGGQPSPNPDYPQEIISCGDRTKNLLNYAKWTNAYIGANGVIYTDNSYKNALFEDYIEVKPNTKYTMSTKTTVNNIGVNEFDSSKTFIKRNQFAYDVSQGTIITTNDTRFIRISINYDGSSAITDNIINNLEPMLELGEIRTSFEPYGYKIPINVRSDNLFDVNWYFDNCVTHNCSKELIENSIKISFTAGADAYIGEARNSSVGTTPAIQNIAIKVKNNTQYTFIASSLPRCYITYMDENYDILNSSYIRFDSSYTKSSHTFTTPVNCKYVAFRMGIQDNEYTEWTFSDIQLVEGSTVPLKYIPYYNETTNIYLDEPLKKIGEYSDYIDFINGKVVRRIKETLLDDNITWITSRFANEKRIYTSSSNIDSNMRGVTSNSQVGYLLSNQYKAEKLENILALSVRYGIGINSTSYFSILNQDYASTTDFLQALHDNPIVLDYALRTPAEESITLPNIPTIDGNNTLNIETELTPSQVYIKYKSNT